MAREREPVRFESDDRDDPDRGVLEIFFGGNLDWYAAMRYAEKPSIPVCVRFSTSGTLLPQHATHAIAILYYLGRGDMQRVKELAQSLAEFIREDEDSDT